MFSQGAPCVPNVSGGLYAWEFEKDGHEVKVRVEVQLIFNGIFELLDAAAAGFGLAYVPETWRCPRSRWVILQECSKIGASLGRAITLLPDQSPILGGIRPLGRRTTPSTGNQMRALTSCLWGRDDQGNRTHARSPSDNLCLAHAGQTESRVLDSRAFVQTVRPRDPCPE